MSYWQGIIPCGLDGVRMISLAQLLDPVPGMQEVIQAVLESFGEVFDFDLIF